MSEPVRARRAVTAVDDGYVAAVMVSAAVGRILRPRRWPRRPARALVVDSSPVLLATPPPVSGETGSDVPLAPLAAVAGARLGARP
jgi:hypothetical protein